MRFGRLSWNFGLRLPDAAPDGVPAAEVVEAMIPIALFCHEMARCTALCVFSMPFNLDS